MSESAPDEFVGKMVKERNALRREGVCLDERLSSASSALLAASHAVTGEYGIKSIEFRYPAAETLTDLLTRRDEVKRRIRELESRLDACC